ncbi:MAG: DUF1178 family protein [Methylovirgula sp.]
MIKYALKCANGHEFDSWFPSAASFDRTGCARPSGMSGLRRGRGRQGNHGAGCQPR